MADDALQSNELQRHIEMLVSQYLSTLASDKELLKRLIEKEHLESDKQNLQLVKEKIYQTFKDKNISRPIYEKVKAMLDSKSVTLDMLGFKYGTDKASVEITSNDIPRVSHDYLRHYESLLAPYRDKKMIMIEFGCFKGASLRMWKEYFGNAEIYGVDLDEDVKRHASERIHIIIGDATQQKTYDEIQQKLGDEKPFIILDDASHAWGDQRRSLELFWKMLAPGGFYIVEDLECGTLGSCPQYPPKVQDSQPFFNYVLDLCDLLRWAPDRRMGSAVDIGFQDITQEIRFRQLPQNVKEIKMSLDSCHLMPGTLALKKKP